MAKGEFQGGRGGCGPVLWGHRRAQGGGRLTGAAPQGRGPSSAPSGLRLRSPLGPQEAL